MQQKEDTINENERSNSFARGFFFHMDQSYLVYNCKISSFRYAANRISAWKSASIFDYFDNSNMNAVGDTSGNKPNLRIDGRMHVYLSGNYFKQDKTRIPNNNNAINIYIVYKLDPIASSRDTTFTKSADTSKYDYKGYGICFDERSEFGHTITAGGFAHTTDARNVSIFGVDMSFSVHKTNRANHIYVMDTGLTQGIHDTSLYAEKNFYRNFTDPGKKFMLNLHYNGDDSYLFVNGRQELKFKCKADQLVKKNYA